MEVLAPPARRSGPGRARGRVLARAGAAVLAVLLVAAVVTRCTPHPVGPARTFDKYEGKAVTTARDALSAVQTVRLAARAGADGNAFGPYLSMVVSEQEGTLTGLQGTFGSVQSPSERADRVRDELDHLLTTASGHVLDVRLAVRRGRLADLAAVAEPLKGDVDALESFIEAHK